MWKQRFAVAISTLVLLAPLVVQADDAAAQAKRHFEKAQTLYAVGDFTEAAAEYKEAYRLKQQPTLLYNLGQTMRQLKDYSQAAFYYQQYLAQTPAAENREQLTELIRELKSKAASQPEKPVVPPATRPPPVMAAPQAPSTPSRKPVLVVSPAAVTAEPTPRWREPRRLAGLASAGVGAILLGITAYEGLHGKTLVNRAEGAYQTNGGAYTPGDLATLRSGNGAAQTANILLATSAGLLAAGAVLFFAF